MDEKTKQILESVEDKLAIYKIQKSHTVIDHNLIKASVLIPLVLWKKKLSILFTKRTGNVNNHQNQISFPGGAIETIDKNPLSASLRETEEEIGIKRNDIRLVGELPPMKTLTGYFIYPFVGFINNLNDIKKNSLEVEKILYVPIDWLRDKNNSWVEMYERPGVEKHPVDVFSSYEGEVIWGITASLLLQFFNAIKK